MFVAKNPVCSVVGLPGAFVHLSAVWRLDDLFYELAVTTRHYYYYYYCHNGVEVV